MNSMKMISRPLIVLLSMGLFTFSAYARSFSFEKSDHITKRAADLLEILVDYENTCESSCRYRVDTVRDMKRLGDVPNAPHDALNESFYVWQKIVDRRTIETILQVNVKKSADGKQVSITSFVPSDEVIRKLENQYHVRHNSLFYEMNIRWMITEKESNGQFAYSDVAYNIDTKSNNRLVIIFAGTVRAGLAKTANQMFDNLRQ